MTSSSASPLRLTRTNGAPAWTGWLFVAMGAGVLLLRQLRDGAGVEERLGLALVAAVLTAVGALVVMRGFRQIITVDPLGRRLLVQDRTRFGSQTRSVPFAVIREVAVESWTDPDPDARPFQQTTHRVLVRLRDGSALPLTDFTLDAAAVAGIREDVARRLG
jgi:hypothetical protein